MTWNLTQQKPVHLVLEDSKLQTQLISALKRVTKEIKSFNNVEEFLSEPLSKAPACLITELALSDIDGVSLIKRMREHGLSTPVIVIASKDDGVYSAVQAIQAGAADFIEQPIVERDFIERVKKALDKAEEKVIN